MHSTRYCHFLCAPLPTLVLTFTSLIYICYGDRYKADYNALYAKYGKWTCMGITEMREKFLPIVDSIKAYHESIGRPRNDEDIDLADTVPPPSMFLHWQVRKIFRSFLSVKVDDLNALLAMKGNCDLFNNAEFNNQVFLTTYRGNSRAVHSMVVTLLRLALCLRKIDVLTNCPDPCKTLPADFCQKIDNVEDTCVSHLPDGINIIEHQKLVEMDLNAFNELQSTIHPNRRLPFEIFEDVQNYSPSLLENAWRIQMDVTQEPYCQCKPKYRFDWFLKKCQKLEFVEMCPKPNPCSNGGACEMQNNEPICKCTPAYTGKNCDKFRDPCESDDMKSYCAPFKCMRSPYNTNTGFFCLCDLNVYRPKSTAEPICVRKVKCTDTSNPCGEGGSCMYDESRESLFYCVCRPGYSGELCENAPPPAKWMKWSPWSECKWPPLDKVCFDNGYQESTRECMQHSIYTTCNGVYRRQRFEECDPEAVSYDLAGRMNDSVFRKKFFETKKLCKTSSLHVRTRHPKPAEVNPYLSAIAITDDSYGYYDEDPDTYVYPQFLKDRIEELEVGPLRMYGWLEFGGISIWVDFLLIQVLLIGYYIYRINRFRLY